MEEKPECICLKDCGQSGEITYCVCPISFLLHLNRQNLSLSTPKQFLNQKGNWGLQVRHNANRSESPSVVIQQSLLHQIALCLSLSVAQAN